MGLPMFGTLLCVVGGCMLGGLCVRGRCEREIEEWRARCERQRERANAWRGAVERLRPVRKTV
jgi:hypothetical protein